MAKSSKSAAIRDHLAKNPEAKAKDVAKQFGVSTALVYGLKVRSKRRVRRAKRAKAAAAGRDAGLADPIVLIRKIRDLAHEAGGMKKLHELVGILTE